MELHTSRRTYPSDANKFTEYHKTLGGMGKHDLGYNEIDDEVEAAPHDRQG